ncbi:MAG TPA: YdcF family protein [Clostridia bacterium]|nr:YdcF family protein [Clostridia bacterium]
MVVKLTKGNLRDLRIIWNYLHLDQKLEKADLILVLGSEYRKNAQRGAELFLEGYADWVVVSGGLGLITKNTQHRPEADIYAEEMIKNGVPPERIYIENQSSNTGENIKFSQKLISEKGLKAGKIIIVTKPDVERRVYAAFKKLWPEPEIMVTSPQASFGEYVLENPNKERVINLMVGNVQRMKVYFGKGFQIYQEIPQEVWEAHLRLAKSGYNQQLVK